ncbi:MAG: host attachment protein [Burkholderiaceae bacterium]|jgi:protein required for attachment to host cells|nr:host attachment protein [Burkholderiaceae bacterium]
MKTQWIVVANASLARVFKREAPGGALLPVATMEHPESRAKGSDLAGDRPGHEASDFSAGGTRFEPRTDPRRKEHRRFAREITERLDQALAHNELGSLALFASDPFLGELKGALSEPLLHRLQAAHNSDFTSLELGALEQRVHELEGRA